MSRGFQSRLQDCSDGVQPGGGRAYGKDEPDERWSGRRVYREPWILKSRDNLQSYRKNDRPETEHVLFRSGKLLKEFTGLLAAAVTMQAPAAFEVCKGVIPAF